MDSKFNFEATLTESNSVKASWEDEVVGIHTWVASLFHPLEAVLKVLKALVSPSIKGIS